ncbi:hypothetical protein [Ideonella sp. YS5]|uniref:hypothetical protein n=1 Tax=Ideonella sp. YS5 TaxID=3453714 RepID=UPI003EEDB3D9
MARRFFCVLSVAALTACAATGAPAEGPSYTVGVVQGQRSVISSENLSLELTSVDDSRCPPKVQCIQAGAVSVTLRLQQAGAASELITLGTPGTALRPAEGRILGYHLILQDVSPRPADDGQAVAYRATLKVVRDSRSR